MEILEKLFEAEIKKGSEGKFDKWCKKNGFKDGVSQEAINAALKAGGDAKKMAVFAVNMSKGKYKYPKGFKKETVKESFENERFKYSGTVIERTTNPEDLIPKFMEVLEDLCLEKANKIKLEYPEVNDDVSFWKYDEWQNECLNELFLALNECAPEGYTFGAHPSDGADFGFWQDETIDEAFDVILGQIEFKQKHMDSEKPEENASLKAYISKLIPDIENKVSFDKDYLEKKKPNEDHSLKSYLKNFE